LKSFEVFWSLWSLLKSHEVFEVFWSLMKSHEVLWSLMKSYEVLWSLMKSFEVSWSLWSLWKSWSLEVRCFPLRTDKQLNFKNECSNTIYYILTSDIIFVLLYCNHALYISLSLPSTCNIYFLSKKKLFLVSLFILFHFYSIISYYYSV
jgi:hypothetical protein